MFYQNTNKHLRNIEFEHLARLMIHSQVEKNKSKADLVVLSNEPRFEGRIQERSSNTTQDTTDH